MDAKTADQLKELLGILSTAQEYTTVPSALGIIDSKIIQAKHLIYGMLNESAAESLTLVRAEQTCFGCPSQWDAWDAEGNQYYLRFRHGSGTVSLRGRMADGEMQWLDDWDEEIASFETGDPYDGIISLPEFAERAGIRLGRTMAAWSQ